MRRRSGRRHGQRQLAVGAVGDAPSRGLVLVAVAAVVLIVALALSPDTALRSTGLAASLVVDAEQVGIGASLDCLGRVGGARSTQLRIVRTQLSRPAPLRPVGTRVAVRVVAATSRRPLPSQADVLALLGAPVRARLAAVEAAARARRGQRLRPVAAGRRLGKHCRWQLAMGAVGDASSRGLGLVAVAAIVLIVALALS